MIFRVCMHENHLTFEKIAESRYVLKVTAPMTAYLDLD